MGGGKENVLKFLSHGDLPWWYEGFCHLGHVSRLDHEWRYWSGLVSGSMCRTHSGAGCSQQPGESGVGALVTWWLYALQQSHFWGVANLARASKADIFLPA